MDVEIPTHESDSENDDKRHKNLLNKNNHKPKPVGHASPDDEIESEDGGKGKQRQNDAKTKSIKRISSIDLIEEETAEISSSKLGSEGTSIPKIKKHDEALKSNNSEHIDLKMEDLQSPAAVLNVRESIITSIPNHEEHYGVVLKTANIHHIVAESKGDAEIIPNMYTQEHLQPPLPNLNSEESIISSIPKQEKYSELDSVIAVNSVNMKTTDCDEPIEQKHKRMTGNALLGVELKRADIEHMVAGSDDASSIPRTANKEPPSFIDHIISNKMECIPDFVDITQ